RGAPSAGGRLTALGFVSPSLPVEHGLRFGVERDALDLLDEHQPIVRVDAPQFHELALRARELLVQRAAIPSRLAAKRPPRHSHRAGLAVNREVPFPARFAERDALG